MNPLITTMSGGGITTYAERYSGSNRFTKPKTPAESLCPLFLEILPVLLFQNIAEKTNWQLRDLTTESCKKTLGYKTQAKVQQNRWINTCGLHKAASQSLLADILSDHLIETILNVTFAWRGEKEFVKDSKKRKKIKENKNLCLFIEDIRIVIHDISALTNRGFKNATFITIPVNPDANSFYSILINAKLSANII